MMQPQKNWPVWRQEDFSRNQMNGVVGQRLVSETDAVRVWLIDMAPGERLPFHRHVLNYFWTATSSGKSRSVYADGSVVESVVKPGDTKHYSFAAGGFMVHDLENIGDTRLSYVTTELKLGSANAPLPLPALPHRTG